MTHILQPLDVGVFRPWKHWHKAAIRSALRSLDFEYNICFFFWDLPGIQENTFKKSTIKYTFATTSIWPVSSKQILYKISKYIQEQSPELLELQVNLT